VEGRPRRRTLSARIGNPMAWNLATRCLTVAGIMITATLLFLAAAHLTGGWPFLRVDPIAPLMPRLSLLVLVVWLGITLAVLITKRYAPNARPLAHVTSQAYAISVALFTCATGAFHSPGWVAFLGGAIVGDLLLGRRATLFGLCTYFVVTLGGAWAIESRTFTVVNDLMPEGARTALAPGETLRLGLITVVLTLLVLGLVAYIVDRWRDREARYQRLARTDGLTGLTNRRKFLELVERELLRARRYNAPLALVLLDLDHFKRVNDTHGHLVGDRVLVHAAETLRQAIRDVDTAARYGGEEFAVLLPDTDLVGAQEVAERCARKLASSSVAVGAAGDVTVTASLGVATFSPESDARVEDLMRRADQALYRAKEAGRNRVMVAA
jgi:diguanylate cyclase (GGDEF)-like protein